MPDLDQGGTFRETTRLYLGPSLGWVQAASPPTSTLTITSAGTTIVQPGTTYVHVNVNGAVTVQLYAAKGNTTGGPGAVSGSWTQPQITINDSGGFAQAFPITIMAAAGETIGGASAVLIAASYGLFVLLGDVQNGGWTVASGTSSSSLGTSVKNFGAAGDGVTDDLVPFNNALASGAQSIFIPPTVPGYRLSAGITVPSGVQLFSYCFMPSNPLAGSSTTTGTKLVFDLGVATCVTLGGSTSLNAASLRGITVTRAAGTIPVGSIGILVNTGYNIELEDILSDRHDTGYKLLAAGTGGISCHALRCHTGAISGNHVNLDGWAESRWTLCRFGMNGVGNLNCNACVQFNNTAGTSAGPNTSAFVNCQFNQGGGGAPAYWWDFNAIAAVGASFFKAHACHVENVSTAYIHNTASAASLRRISISGTSFNTPNIPFVSLVSTTQINEWNILGNFIFTSGATTDLTNVLAINGLNMIGNRVEGTWNITSTSGGQGDNAAVNFVGNQWLSGALTIAGNGWRSGIFKDSYASGSTFTNSATAGSFAIANPGQIMTWTPVLQFGGASTGITYSGQQGVWTVDGTKVMATFRITLTSKGSAVGATTISGLPLTVGVSGHAGDAGGGSVNYYTGMSGLTGALVTETSAGTQKANVFQTGAAGIVTTSDTNFTNTSVIYGTITYFL